MKQKQLNELNLRLNFQHITHLLQKSKNITSLNYVKYLNHDKQKQCYKVSKQ